MILIVLLLFALPVVYCGDRRCTNQDGHCQSKRRYCGGFYVSGLCSGRSSRKCCLPESKGISQECLDCICKQESGCQPLKCGWDKGSNSCGYFQIKYNYWKDCGRPGRSWKSCAKNKSCSEKCVRNYMIRYGWRCTRGREPTCQDFARVHNGGPHGCRRSSTRVYWNHVAKQGCTRYS